MKKNSKFSIEYEDINTSSTSASINNEKKPIDNVVTTTEDFLKLDKYPIEKPQRHHIRGKITND